MQQRDELLRRRVRRVRQRRADDAALDAAHLGQLPFDELHVVARRPDVIEQGRVAFGGDLTTGGSHPYQRLPAERRYAILEEGIATRLQLRQLLVRQFDLAALRALQHLCDEREQVVILDRPSRFQQIADRPQLRGYAFTFAATFCSRVCSFAAGASIGARCSWSSGCGWALSLRLYLATTTAEFINDRALL